MMKNIHVLVCEIISEELGREVTDDLDLFDNGLDSLETLRVLSFIESRLNIEIPDDELIMDNFVTISALVSMVNKYV